MISDGVFLTCGCVAFWGQSLVDQWIDFASLEIDANVGRWLYPKFGYFPYSKEV